MLCLACKLPVLAPARRGENRDPGVLTGREQLRAERLPAVATSVARGALRAQLLRQGRACRRACVVLGPSPTGIRPGRTDMMTHARPLPR